MNYNFTDSVRKALSVTRDKANDTRHYLIGTEHMLLGILSDPDIIRIINSLRVSESAIESEVAARVPLGNSPVRKGEIPYSGGAKKVLELAMVAARQRGDSYVGTEHVLIGIVQEEAGIGGQVLRTFGLQVNEQCALIRDESEQRIGGPVVQIDDGSDRSIYEQIVAQITEAVATGGLKSGGRLPTVRQMADNLDVAPGTVARAYSELERQGVVVTEGARGTRVAERPRASMEAMEQAETLTGLLRPVAVAAFHLGSNAADLREALERAMTGIFENGDRAADHRAVPRSSQGTASTSSQ